MSQDPALSLRVGPALERCPPYTLCIPIVEKDDKSEAAKRQAAMQFYGDQAMAMLRDAVGKGYKDAAHMKKDADLDPIRDRAEFKKLVAEVEKGR